MIRAPLNNFAIAALLPADYWRVRVIETVLSTQDELKFEGVAHGECVVAEFQSSGRGRLGRKFDSLPNVALLVSFFIKPKRKAQWGWIPLIAGAAVARTLNSATGSHDFKTKWPNDVICESGKISGILCERYGDGIIVGIGVNVSALPEELPVESATSVFIQSGIELDRNEFLPTLLENFRALFNEWESGVDLSSTYRALSQTIGSEVRVSFPDLRTTTGRAIGVDGEGRLKLENGEFISAGDIHHLR